nr:aromatic amino acid ammonia-lyase [Hymenobacter psoromatis]
MPAASEPPAPGALAYPAAHWLLAYACGTGPEVPPELVRRLLLLKAHNLSLAASPNSLLLKRLLDFYNRDVWPVIYEQGTPATPLAHLALPLLGLGEVNYQGYRLAAADVLGLFGWEPLALTLPEGQALLAGAEFALAYATEALERAELVLRADVAIAALSASAPAPGPTPASLAEAARVVEAACNAPESAAGLPGAFSQVAVALAAVGEASARRTGQLLAAPPTVGAMDFVGLVALPAVAASLAAASQRLAGLAEPHPTDVRWVAENTEQLLGLELLAAAQALDERRAASGEPVPAVVAALREVVTFVAHDRLLAPDLHRAARFVREYEWA